MSSCGALWMTLIARYTGTHRSRPGSTERRTLQRTSPAAPTTKRTTPRPTSADGTSAISICRQIVAGHEAQLRSQERYRIPEDLLQPHRLRQERSRPCRRTVCGKNPPAPAAAQQLPLAQHSQHSRRSVSSFYFPTPDWQASARTPLFLTLDVRTNPGTPHWASRSPSPQSSLQPPAKRARLNDADNPAVQWFRRVSDLLDLAALDDSDEETSNTEGDEDLELDQDNLGESVFSWPVKGRSCRLDFIDDEPDAHHQMPLMAPIAEEDVARLAQIAALYEEEADGYAEAALLEQAGVAEMSPAATLLAHDPTVARTVQDAVNAVMPRPAPTLPPKLPGLVVPHPPIIPSSIPETAAQVTRRVRRLLVSPRPRRTLAWTDESQQEKEKQPQKKRDAAQRRDHHNFVEPGTWIRLRVEDTQQHAGLLAFTVSETWCIVARHQPVETTHFNLDNGDLLRRDDGTESVRLSRPLRKNTHPRLYPTIDKTAPFQSCTHPIFETAHFVGHSQAIQLGDCVIVYRGVHAGLAGYVVHIKDVLVKNPDSSSVQRWVTMMRISTRFPGTTRDISELPGGWVQLGQLRRHVLCPSPPLRLFDRVRIIGHRDAMFLPFGYVTNIADAEEHAALVAVEEENGTSALVPLHNVELFKSQGAARMLEDMAEMTTMDALMQRHTFFLRVPDIYFAMFNEYSVVYPNECSHSVVPQLSAPLPVAQLSPDACRAADRRAREDDARAASDEKTALQATLQTLNAIAPPETLQHLQDRISYFKNGLKKMVKGRQDLIKGVGRRYEGLQGSVWKGHRGIVVGDLDSPEHAARLSEQTLKKRWYMRADTRGIMVTVKEQDGRHFTEKIEKLYGVAPGLSAVSAADNPLVVQARDSPTAPSTPTPPPDEASDWTLPDVPSDYKSHRIPGESNGEWLCNPSLTDKRVDVVLRGIGRMVKTRHWNPSALLMGLEGSTGYLLLEEAITPTSLQSRKIRVYGVARHSGSTTSRGSIFSLCARTTIAPQSRACSSELLSSGRTLPGTALQSAVKRRRAPTSNTRTEMMWLP
ncbi:hypothetical protein B0H17DRAFT_1149607 [Mycena rosella]|uniref:Uncharacterized protein n=1 Tax=Mycena rosella TaxID=1033263 RepID=A0AAD7C2F3_MYCRO|nr:hypothetical protein B0H17DRAFT_1149607 [Mycena rosella]